MNKRKFRKMFILLILLPLHVGSAAYESFYYIEKARLELRLVKFLAGEPELLVNYPSSPNGDEYQVEQQIMLNYNISATADVIKADVGQALSSGDYYAFVAISASISTDDQKIAFILKCSDLLGVDKSKNALIAYGVLNIIKKDFFITPESKVNKARVKSLRVFTTKLRNVGYQAGDWNQIKNIDWKIVDAMMLVISQ